MYYRYEYKNKQGYWEGIFQYLNPAKRRLLGRHLSEPRYYDSSLLKQYSRCWFTEKGYAKYSPLIEKLIQEEKEECSDGPVEVRILSDPCPPGIIQKTAIQAVQDPHNTDVLYRYELYVDQEYQDCGIFQGLEDLGLSDDRVRDLMFPFNKNLPLPCEDDTKGGFFSKEKTMRGTTSFFTAEGAWEFQDALADIIREYDEHGVFEVLVFVVQEKGLPKKAIRYRDQLQVLIETPMLDRSRENIEYHTYPIYYYELREGGPHTWLQHQNVTKRFTI